MNDPRGRSESRDIKLHAPGRMAEETCFLGGLLCDDHLSRKHNFRSLAFQIYVGARFDRPWSLRLAWAGVCRAGGRRRSTSGRGCGGCVTGCGRAMMTEASEERTGVQRRSGAACLSGRGVGGAVVRARQRASSSQGGQSKGEVAALPEILAPGKLDASTHATYLLFGNPRTRLLPRGTSCILDCAALLLLRSLLLCYRRRRRLKSRPSCAVRRARAQQPQQPATANTPAPAPALTSK